MSEISQYVHPAQQGSLVPPGSNVCAAGFSPRPSSDDGFGSEDIQDVLSLLDLLDDMGNVDEGRIGMVVAVS